MSSSGGESVEELEAAIKKSQDRIEQYKSRGYPPEAYEGEEEKVKANKKKLRAALAKPKPHPALQFGPVAQTVAIMCCISLGMSVVALPWQMLPFYVLFSRLTIVAVVCLVVYTSIIWYGYNAALAASRGPPKDPNDEIQAKLQKLLTPRPDRPDLPAASVRDELWWEGGNAPHVGHFNKPTIPEPGIGNSELRKVLLERAMKSMELEKQRSMWKKRIQSVQILCVVVVVALVNKTLAVTVLAWLIYSTVASEIDAILAPPEDMTDLHKKIKAIADAAGKKQSAPRMRGKPGEVEGGMSYIFNPNGDASIEHLADVPIAIVPPPVLVTTNDHLRAGPGATLG